MNKVLPAPDWKNPHYLQAGSPRQQRAYAVLQELGIWSTLSTFDPVLAGTIPLGIDVEVSDLDIICEAPLAAQDAFGNILRRQYGSQPSFRLTQALINGCESVVCRFRYADEELEIFGQPLPTARQNAFRHMVVEHAVLLAGGEPWRAAVQHLKAQGLKTEPAFAMLLQLPGDPYEALLTLEDLTPSELRERLTHCPLPLSPDQSATPPSPAARAGA
jgi:hypothetical protein